MPPFIFPCFCEIPVRMLTPTPFLFDWSCGGGVLTLQLRLIDNRCSCPSCRLHFTSSFAQHFQFSPSTAPSPSPKSISPKLPQLSADPSLSPASHLLAFCISKSSQISVFRFCSVDMKIMLAEKDHPRSRYKEARGNMQSLSALASLQNNNGRQQKLKGCSRHF